MMAGCGAEYEGTVDEEPEQSTEAIEAGYYNAYSTVSALGSANGCGATQAFGVGSTYAYSIKINGDDTRAVIYRTNMSTGDTTLMTDGATHATWTSGLGHANDMALAKIDDQSHMFVVTMKAGSASLVKLRYSGTSYHRVGAYRIQYNGEDHGMSGVAITGRDASNLHFLFKSGRTVYRGVLPLRANSGTIRVTHAFTLDVEHARVNGRTIPDIGSYLSQGMGYRDDTLYVPLTHANISVVLVYRHVATASGIVTADPGVSFRITSAAYPEGFEIESVGVDATHGRLWFNCNRRAGAGQTAHDAVAYFKGFNAF